ncbi:SDR family NAD(P)-dependent oxidoreductase [Thalassobium sp. R2A62]|jgi:2-deoxy-D-gluconate 3-dehydrogenase|uniref:SDR family NAD(P)-dependent oxidoreductase n=1 Tax=Thalassobium sp. R2A62 TaxID=633131 RepID=UPI0001B1D13E|nr:SDR family oxidoreductase [Thalassobium sp. R2A62]EET47183.1 2-deoxy-D-gluconate 3-dehydrogenase [Thalassobium sp. R2A62]MDG1338855.1 SDR family oxidoreductase [Paracoccaceae bacterium]MDG2451873.1 SDR family oxidoreductase [Paracoccaceae bacterium]
MTLPQTPSFRLDGRRAFVPGGSRGIGLGCAVALAEAGAHVVIAARGVDQTSQAAQAINDSGFSAEAAVLDVSDISAIQSFYEGQEPFDILCNSAGVARHTHTLDTTPEDFDAVSNLNFRSAYFLAQIAAKGMVGKGGSIIQISSQMGHVGGQERAVYCGTKHAIEGITKGMAIDLGPHNIRFNSICPTFVKTPLTAPTFADPDKVAWIKSKIKLDRIGEVEDIMGAVLFLASDASALITGTSILIDGGWTAG